MLSEKVLKALAEAEEACTCKFCGRCVLAGPPCCYDKIYHMYQELVSERDWLRKIQSKKDKKINELQRRLQQLHSKE